MKTTAVLTFFGFAATALAQCGVPNGARCTTPGQIACEYMGGHMVCAYPGDAGYFAPVESAG
ncbi:hypothetical protein ColTof4_06288 [Colletotrichum tofieldiae]|nr:hypothetical protein ColTof3_01473 [Colletotrichum tofieldiae]GKT73865.1 hypothetical protein ColTof4_06288 [Colletotrichum tofieldiae]